ncbi:protein kinase domain-containing protein [Zavarzinella formosa]|uniref:protein kinase domain-containing protein n=1 Tax=Zavarzinella formosa TaxID=360055 RepID=UPI00031DFC83|nr:serine/threonine-protein kinase [Zavarzinella formosa]
MALNINQAPAETVTQVWAEVGDCLEAFAKKWDTDGTPPQIGDFLPGEPPEVRRIVLVEIIKFDQHERFRRGLSQTLDQYLRDFPELGLGDGPPADLIFEDYQLQRKAGRTVDTDDYFIRYPKRAAELAQLLGVSSPARTTSVMAARPPKIVGPGDRLDDFDLLAQLGEGSFARVFLARQVTMQRLVALKVSASRGAEAETLAQLDHPNIVRVYDQRYIAERGLLLVYMPYLAGGTLLDVLERVRKKPVAERSGKTLLEAVDAVLHRRGEVPPAVSDTRRDWAARNWPATVCLLGAKLANALDYAHRKDVLHRDVKPANVLLTADGEPLLADFNIGCCSKLDGAGPASFFGGSLAYMSAEHLEAFNPQHPRKADSLDGQADVFGLAVTLWELLTGEKPFPRERLTGDWSKTLSLLVEQRRQGPSITFAAAFDDNDVPGLRDVLLSCLDPDPANRPASAGELARELELCLQPATRKLLRPESARWREVVRRHPLLTLLPVGLAPNGLAALFNISYNRAEIIDPWENAQEVFQTIIMIVNGIFFPLGVLIFALSVLSVMRGLKRLPGQMNAAELARIRLKSLRLGVVASYVCVGCWVTAGIIWPLTLRIIAGPPPQGAGVYVHFLLSLLICGLVASAYPYFLIMFLTVRVIYPALLGAEGPAPADAPALHRVERELSFFRVAAASIPLLTVAVLASREVKHPFAVAAMSAAGLAGTLAAFMLEGRTRADLAALLAGQLRWPWPS